MVIIHYFIMRAGHDDILHHHLLWRDAPWAHWTKWERIRFETEESFAIKLVHPESAGMVLHLPVRRRIVCPRTGGSYEAGMGGTRLSPEVKDA